MAPVPKPKRERTKHFFKEWREHCDLTQEEAAGRLNWSQSKLSRIEAGATPYNQDDLEAAAEAYECKPWQIISMDPSEEGDVADLVRLLNEAQRDQAVRVLKALTGTA
jgi:transcriptional regulator with XRE-family HTH domain